MATAFYEMYRKLCEKAGKSDNAVAAEIGLSNSTVTTWRQGALPRRPTIKKVADYFGVTVEEMMGYAQKEKPPINKDEELTEYLEELRNRPEKRMLFSVTKNATKAQIEAIVKMIEEMQGN